MFGALSALLGVAAGAFGAHALRGRLTPEMLAVFETGVRYQIVHALALVALTAVPLPGGRLLAPGWLFVVGTVLFSGSLYALALSGVRPLGAITPLGGLCFLTGWAMLAYAFVRR